MPTAFERTRPEPPSPISWRPSYAMLLLFCDCLVILGCYWFVIFLRHAISPLSLEAYLHLSLILLLAPFLGQALGTCQDIALPQPREIKALSLAISLTFMGLMLLLFATRSGEEFSRLVIFSAWLFSLFAAPIARSLLRRHCCRYSWWGCQLVVLGKSNLDDLRANLEAYPERGIRIVAQFDEMLVNGSLNPQIAATARRHMNAFILFSPDAFAHYTSTGAHDLSFLLSELNRHFKGVLLLPHFLVENPFIWLTPRDLGNSLALLVRHNLYDKYRLLLKRIMDICLVALSACLTLPLWLVIMLAIMLDSTGSPIYFQERIGRKGIHFRVFKFRTMVQNADALLEAALAENNEQRLEWMQTHKLKNDPRITRVGAILRKTSLDELPQLWNVIKGDMSLVGPRPIVEEEIEKYGSIFEDYIRVRPGLTGLWQISGRSDTSYAQRVLMDLYYISNWSIWFDIWVIAKTIPRVLLGRGAY